MSFLEYALIIVPMFACAAGVIKAIEHLDGKLSAALELNRQYLDRLGDMGSDHIQEQRESFQAIHSKLNKG